MLHGGKALSNEPETLTGVVLGGAHGIYDVHTDNGILRCTLRGKLKKAFAHAQAATRTTGRPGSRYEKISPAPRYQRELQEAAPARLTVGDYVKVRQLDEKNGLIEEILPRQSSLSRKDAGSTDKKTIEQTMLANLDYVVLVFAVAHPEPHFAMLDRYLAICESAEIRP